MWCLHRICHRRDEQGRPTKMKPGKMAAQCCHACLGAYKLARKHAPSAVRSWALTGQAKVCVKVPTEAHLFELKESLERAGICSYLVEDAGRTQVSFLLCRLRNPHSPPVGAGGARLAHRASGRSRAGQGVGPIYAAPQAVLGWAEIYSERITLGCGCRKRVNALVGAFPVSVILWNIFST